MTSDGGAPYEAQYDAQYDAQDDVHYEPPCKAVLRNIVTCDACGKRITMHTLRYRHICIPTSVRLQRATAEAQQAVQDRADATADEEKSNKYAQFFMR